MAEEQQVVEQTEEQKQAESNDAFASGFNETRGVEEKPVAAAEEIVEVKAVEAPAVPEKTAETPPPDPMAEVKAQFESQVGKLSERFRNLEGKLGGIAEQVKTALATAKTVESTGKDAPTKTQIESAGKSTERWKQLKEDFPDWADAVDDRFAEMQAAIPAAAAPVDVGGLRTEIMKDVDQRVAAARDEGEQLALVSFKHNGWKQTIQTPEFEAWFKTQTPDIQALARSPAAPDAIRMLDSFEESRKKAEAAAKAKVANEQRLKSAITPTGVGAASPQTLNDEDAFNAGFKSVRQA